MKQPIFKDSKGNYQSYGDTSKKDLIRICYIFSKEAQKFMQGFELFKTKYSVVLLLQSTDCPTCADHWATFGEVIPAENEE